jgi:hypothetical protein
VAASFVKKAVSVLGAKVDSLGTALGGVITDGDAGAVMDASPVTRLGANDVDKALADVDREVGLYLGNYGVTLKDLGVSSSPATTTP